MCGCRHTHTSQPPPAHLFCSMSSDTDLNVTRRVEMTSPEVNAVAAESGDIPDTPAPIMEGVPGVEGKTLPMPPPLVFRSPEGRGEASEREGGGSGSPRSRCTSASSWGEGGEGRTGLQFSGTIVERPEAPGRHTSWGGPPPPSHMRLCQLLLLHVTHPQLHSETRSRPPGSETSHTTSHLCQLLLHVACPQLQSPPLAL